MIGCPTDARVVTKDTHIRFITRLLVAIYLIEAGLLLVVAPWTLWWWQNFFADVAGLRPIMASGVVRGAVVLAGLVTTLAGVSDLRDVIFGRLAGRVSSEGRQTPDA